MPLVGLDRDLWSATVAFQACPWRVNTCCGWDLDTDNIPVWLGIGQSCILAIHVSIAVHTSVHIKLLAMHNSKNLSQFIVCALLSTR